MGKQMIRLIPQGSCPKCQHKQFVVYDNQSTMYLTNRDGAIIDSKELDHISVGMCCNCGTTFEMFPTSEGFIPLTPMRKIVYDYTITRSEPSHVKAYIDNAMNPMQKI